MATGHLDNWFGGVILAIGHCDNYLPGGAMLADKLDEISFPHPVSTEECLCLRALAR